MSEVDRIDPNAWAERWKAAGLDKLEAKCRTIDASVMGGEIWVHVSREYLASGEHRLSSQWLYRIDGRGEIKLEIRAQRNSELPSLPRVGVEFELPLNTREVSWLGRGPHENYPDRKLSADIGSYTRSLEEMHTDYIFPTENGLRCDCQTLRVGSLLVEGWFHFGVSPYSQENLAEARHTNELVKEDRLYLRLDGYHMGVGGDDSWSPSVHSEFLLEEPEYCYSLTLKPAKH